MYDLQCMHKPRKHTVMSNGILKVMAFYAYRLHEGRIGGAWRHIKEVLGYRGSQICFVDGKLIASIL